MTTVPAPSFAVRLPSRQELRSMFNRPAVFITGLVCATITILSVVGGIVFLVATGKPTEALTSFIGGVVLTGLVGLFREVRSISNTVKSQNGNNGSG